MIYYLRGKITFKEKDFIIFDVQGIGYKVFVEGYFNDEKIIYCFMQKSDKDIKLFGFKERGNLELFEKLIKMPGIGPKTALRIASITSAQKLKEGIEKEDKEIMTKIFSIGRKKGQQVVFELTEKFFEKKEDEAFQILKNLGFSDDKINKTLRKTGHAKNEEERIKKALKILGE